MFMMQVQGALGGASEAAVYSYFDGRFPQLFLATWQWACASRACQAEPDLKEWLRNWGEEDR